MSYVSKARVRLGGLLQNVHLPGSPSVQSDIFELLSGPTAEVQEVLAAVQHTSKAREDEDFLPLLYDQLVDNLIQYDELSRCMYHVVAEIIRVRLCMRKNVWVVTALNQVS